MLLLANDINKTIRFLLSAAKSTPTHPIFKYFSVEDRDSIRPKIADNIRIGVIQGSHPPTTIILQEFFPDMQKEDHITLVCISTGWNTYRKTTQSDPINQVIGILEFDALSAPHANKSWRESSLGLEPKDFGLLHDINGINGSEPLEPYLNQLSAKIKEQLFQNINITPAKAEEFLTTVPIVFAYVAKDYLTQTLDATLKSPIIQQAIAEGKKPVFYITDNSEDVTLPKNLVDAKKSDKIRIVRTWLDHKDFQIVNALLMNKKTQSIVIPSGDNSLTQCIKSGKFPLYAHKPILHASEFQFNFKCGIFKSMLNLVESTNKQAWKEHPGFAACCNTLKYLARKPSNDGIVAHYKGMEQHIISPMLDFFRDHLAPYLMDNFAFERSKFTRLLKLIQNGNTVSKLTIPPPSTTVKFDQHKNEIPPIGNANSTKQQVNRVDNNSKPSYGTFTKYSY